MSTPTTFWRLAGVSYVQYVSKASSTLRAALREPARSKAAAQESFAYNRATYAKGVPSQKVKVDQLDAVGK